MKVEQIYTKCIAHAAYYLESNGEAAIFDPLREVEPYIERAKKDNAKIKYVFETHFHADFVSGHLDLMKKTGAKIVFGPTAKPNYEALVAEDNQEFKLGNYVIRVIHTPGHTMESTCYLLIDEHGNEHGIITGDTLFIGDVGRPDLAQHVNSSLTEEKLAGHLFDSLRNKIIPLKDELIVYPNHGAGSACGKMMSKETTDTLGNQKKVNYALKLNWSKEEFTKNLLNGLTTPPVYFPQNVLMNIGGYESLDSILDRSKRPLDVATFEALANEKDIVLIDSRNAQDFSNDFVPGSINIGIDGNFAQWVGELIASVKQKILLITDIGKEEETIIRLSRIGYDNVVGYLDGGFSTWKNSGKKIESTNRINAKELEEQYLLNVDLIDVRKKSEYDSEHVFNAINIPLNQLEKRMAELNRDKKMIVYCAGGYRSMIASSILKKNKFENFADVIGGFDQIKKTNIPKSEFVCQTTLL